MAIVPFGMLRVKGATLSSVPKVAPSIKNCTPTTPILSVAVAENATALVMTAPLAGDVIATVGGIASGRPLEMIRFTGKPRNSQVPAGGSVLITLPAGTVVLEPTVTVPTVRPLF